MLFLLSCIVLLILILIVAVVYVMLFNKDSMDITQFIDLLYKDNEEK